MRRLHALLVSPLPAAFLVFALGLGCPGKAVAQKRIDFSRDIRPLLSDACFQCHGPDEKQRKAGLSLHTRQGVGAARGKGKILTPGSPQQSELYRRISSKDPEQRMPPPDSGGKLSAEQIELVRRWIEEGAAWEEHWAFGAPRQERLPAVRDAAWPRQPLDHFVLARLEKEGLRPAEEADRVTLLRRVTLDLTGLPPTPGEVDAFLADDSPDAYEQAVARLLASPRYGEHMASVWLDGARYADTSGYQSDGERYMWRWRDWVIDAYNSNMPFDRFTIEQLAGDLLPSATLEQRIATGFNRNHRGNAEGGIIPEEYAVEYVVDRVETTAAVWMGLTLGCARCHDHKYDPFTQREFYQLFAFFNNVPEQGRAIKLGNSPPFIPAPTRAQRQRLAALDARLARARAEAARLRPELRRAQQAWEASSPTVPSDWTVTRGQVAHFPLDRPVGGPASKEGKVVARGSAGTHVPGMLGGSLSLDGEGHLEVADAGDFDFLDSFSCAAWVRPAAADAGTILSRMTDTDRADGYSLRLEKGRVQVNLVKRWLDDALRVETEEKLTPGKWHHVLFTYDGSRIAGGVRVYIDGKPARIRVLLDELNQTFKTKEPFRIGAGGGSRSRFRGLVDDVRIHATVLSEAEAGLLATPEDISAILAIPPGKRSARQAHKLATYYLAREAPGPIRKAAEWRTQLGRERQALVESFPSCMVMEEMPTPRETFVLLRGQYDKPGERVRPGVPAVLPPLPEGKPDRLALARWLVSPSHPLTARVQVNRVWQTLFGAGLVRTAEDFGSQGEAPTYPALLDWLAVEHVRSGWDVKKLVRLLVTSATYRQSARVAPELLRRDPENRLLARGPRFRLSAETIRDQALLASGLLVESVGGPSVKPYQPEGLWKELTGTTDYVPDEGAGRHRRSLYTFWKRTVAPPTMMLFDAAARETCVVRRSRTCTPLQALALLNDLTYVEAARFLAERVLRERSATEARLELAFRLVAARRPSSTELGILRRSLAHHLEAYRLDPDAARKLLDGAGTPPDGTLDLAETAAWTALASTLLNLDEVVTRE